MSMLEFENIEEFDLLRAVNYVIEQNISVGYPPTEFIAIVRRATSEGNLSERISSLVLNAELLKKLEKVIRRNPEVLTIEDLIVLKSDGFGLNGEVICQAKGRAEYFDQLRFNSKNVKN